MRIGEKILCKKNFNDNYYRPIFRKNVFYTITKILYISNYKKHFGPELWRRMSEEEKKIYVSSYWIEISDSENTRQFSLIRMGECNYFYEHFYSTKELRKNNLLKINELYKSTI